MHGSIYTSQLVQDFFHQQYVCLCSHQFVVFLFQNSYQWSISDMFAVSFSWDVTSHRNQPMRFPWQTKSRMSADHVRRSPDQFHLAYRSLGEKNKKRINESTIVLCLFCRGNFPGGLFVFSKRSRFKKTCFRGEEKVARLYRWYC